MTWIEDAIRAMREFDASRPRSQQAEVGWSEAGGCRSAIGFRLSGAFATDEPDTWAAQRGTAIHEYAGPILAKTFPGARVEVDTVYRGIPGHADIVEASSVTDIKTTTAVNSKRWATDHSLLRPKRIQVHGYAAGLVDAGDLPEDCTVRLLVIAVDGTFADWWCYEEKFDRSLADEGADRLEDVRARLATGEPLPKDNPFAFCESYCQFFSLCRNPATERDAAEEITNPDLASAIARYGEINAIITPLDKEKKSLAPVIRGLRGTAGDWRISLGAPGDWKTGLDEEKIRADYEARGEVVPEISKPGNAPKLTVTRIKRKGAAT